MRLPGFSYLLFFNFASASPLFLYLVDVPPVLAGSSVGEGFDHIVHIFL